jgi:tetratricopeptide (TPR) repeat protein
LQRWKRWEDALESAQHFNEKNNEKEAKNSLKAALREADRIDYSYFPFFETVSILMEFSGGEKKALADLQAQVKTRAQRFEAAPTLGGPLNAMQLQACGTLFDFLQDYEASLALHQKATELVANQVAQNEPNITLVDDVDVRNELAGTLLAMERFDEALPLYLTNAEVLEQYLCPNHVELLEMLEPAYRCLTSLGQEKEAEAMLERINTIDPNYLEALAATDHDCDDCGHEHH